MTARWSGVEQPDGTAATPLFTVLDLPGETFEAEGSRKVTLDRGPELDAEGQPRAPGGQSPEVESKSSARDVNVGCRNGVPAS
jgi:hypothetical protein